MRRQPSREISTHWERPPTKEASWDFGVVKEKTFPTECPHGLLRSKAASTFLVSTLTCWQSLVRLIPDRSPCSTMKCTTDAITIEWRRMASHKQKIRSA